MTTSEVEALAKVYWNVARKSSRDGGGEDASHHAGLEAVARAVHAQDAARAGTLTAEALERCLDVMIDGDTDADACERAKVMVQGHSAAQGRANAELEKERDEARATIAALTEQVTNLAKALANEQRWRQADLGALGAARARVIAAESALATLRQALERELVQWSAERSWCRGCRTETAQRVDGSGIRVATPHTHASTCPLDATPAEHPDTATLRGIRERFDGNDLRDVIATALGYDVSKLDDYPADLRRAEDVTRAVERHLLGDSGPSGGGEKSCPNGKCQHPAGDHGVDNPSGTRLALVCCHDCPCGWDTAPGDVIAEGPDFRMTDAGNGYVRQESKPTTPPDVAAMDFSTVMAACRAADEEASKHTPDVAPREPDCAPCEGTGSASKDKSMYGAADCKPCAGSGVAASEPTPEEDWRTVEEALRHNLSDAEEFSGPRAIGDAKRALAALARLKAEPRRAAEVMRQRAADCVTTGDIAEVRRRILALPLD